MATSPNLQQQAVLAYRIWEQEGRPEGCAEQHWRRAAMLLEVEFRIGFPDASEDTDPAARFNPAGA